MQVHRRALWCGAVVVAGLLCGGCQSDNGPVVAYVNGQEISQNDYLARLESGGAAMPGEKPGEATLSRMINEQLLIAEATRQGVAPKPAEVASLLTALQARPDYQQIQKATGMTDEQIQRQLLEPTMAQDRLLQKLAGVKDADITKFIQDNKEKLTEAEQVRARVLQFPDRKKAEDALKLVGKSSFEAIAQTMGLNPASAGIVSIHRTDLGAYPKLVIDKAFSLKKGQTSGIIEASAPANFLQPNAPPSAKQYVILSVEEKMPARPPDPTNMFDRERIIGLVAQQKGGASITPATLQEMTSKLREAAIKSRQIQVVRPGLKDLETTPPAPPAPNFGG